MNIKRALIYSLILHVTIVAVTLVASPFDFKKKWEPGDVIKVTISSPMPQAQAGPMPAVQAGKTAEAPQASIPQKDIRSIPIDKAKAAPKSKSTAKKEPAKKQPPKDLSDLFGPANVPINSPATTEGSPFAGAAIDNSSFNYPYWFPQAFNKILTNWRNTVESDGPLICVVYFQVIRSGRIVEPRVLKPSGIPAFDNGCVLAIEKSAPFPPLPDDFRDEIIGITIPFKYEP
jgi:TonB family protein